MFQHLRLFYCWVVFILWMYHNLCICSPVDGHRGCFWVLTSVNKVAKYSCTRLGRDMFSYFSWKTSWCGLTGSYGVRMTRSEELPRCFLPVRILLYSRIPLGNKESQEGSGYRLLNCYQPGIIGSCIRRSRKPLCASGEEVLKPINKCKVPRGGPQIITETKQIQKWFRRNGWDKDVTKPHGCSQLGRDPAFRDPNIEKM